MTREEKQKGIDALKISAPVMAVTQEEFNDYIQTINQVMDWLEQEPKSEWEHDHEILKAYSDGANEVLDKITVEIEQVAEEESKFNIKGARGLKHALKIINKYKAELESENIDGNR